MSSLKKIYDLEITPPVGAWRNIAAALDDVETNQKISQKLNQIEVMPPAGIWSNIDTELESVNSNKGIASKLYNAKILPPAAAWSNIEKALDDAAALQIIEQKLSRLQVQPPTSTWTNIRNVLEQRQKPQAIVVPMHHGWLKYAAAACFIAIVSVMAYFLLADEGISKGVAVNNTEKTPVGGVNIPIKTEDNITTKSVVSAKDQAMASLRTKLGNAYAVSSEKNADLQGRYIVLMTPDGNIVRMSKKVGNMADCIAGEDHSCDDQISQWQKEMATSTSTATPDNFLGILDMVDEDAQSQKAAPNF